MIYSASGAKNPLRAILSKKLPLSITGVILLAKFDLSCFLLSFTCIFAQWIVCRRHGLASLCPFFLKAKRGYGRSELNARTKTEKNVYKKKKKKNGLSFAPRPAVSLRSTLGTPTHPRFASFRLRSLRPNTPQPTHSPVHCCC